jgi:hypothetical protein
MQPRAVLHPRSPWARYSGLRRLSLPTIRIGAGRGRLASASYGCFAGSRPAPCAGRHLSFGQRLRVARRRFTVVPARCCPSHPDVARRSISTSSGRICFVLGTCLNLGGFLRHSPRSGSVQQLLRTDSPCVLRMAGRHQYMCNTILFVHCPSNS